MPRNPLPRTPVNRGKERAEAATSLGPPVLASVVVTRPFLSLLLLASQEVVRGPLTESVAPPTVSVTELVVPPPTVSVTPPTVSVTPPSGPLPWLAARVYGWESNSSHSSRHWSSNS